MNNAGNGIDKWCSSVVWLAMDWLVGCARLAILFCHTEIKEFLSRHTLNGSRNTSTFISWKEFLIYKVMNL